MSTAKITNIRPFEGLDSPAISYSVTIGDVTVENCLEWLNVLDGDEIDTHYDTNDTWKIAEAVGCSNSELPDVFGALEAAYKEHKAAAR